MKRQWLLRLAAVLVLLWLFLLSPARVPINRAFFILNNSDRTFTANYWLGFAPYSAMAALLCKLLQTVLLVLPEKSTMGAMLDLFGTGTALAIGWAGTLAGQALLYGLARVLLAGPLAALCRRVSRAGRALQWVRGAAPWLAFAGTVCPFGPSGLFALIWGAAGCPPGAFLAGAVPGVLFTMASYTVPALGPVRMVCCVLAVFFPVVRALRGRA